jgi:hypothetical protein
MHPKPLKKSTHKEGKSSLDLFEGFPRTLELSFSFAGQERQRTSFDGFGLTHSTGGR